MMLARSLVLPLLFTAGATPTLPRRSAPAAEPTPASSSPAATAPKQAVKLTLGRDAQVYNVGVNFNFQTRIKTPVPCEHPAIGDPEAFAVLFNPKAQWQDTFFVSVPLERLGATTNLTLDCQEGVALSIVLTQVPPEQATLLVEFEFDSADSARLRAALESQEKRLKSECEQRVATMRDEESREAEDRLLRGMIRRLSTNDDIEAARRDFVIVRVFQEVVVGDRGYILFSVQNRTSNPIVIKDADVLDADSEQPLLGAHLIMPEQRVAPDAVSVAVVSFDAPENLGRARLTVREDGPREIVVDDIDF